MAETLTIRNLDKEDNKMLQDVQKIVNEKTATKALVRGGYRVIQLEKENYELKQRNNELHKELYEIKEVLRDFVQAQNRLIKIAK